MFFQLNKRIMSYLYGPPNPKTLIPPIIPPPIADFESWRDSSRAPNNYINSTTPVYYSSSSGYAATIPDKYFQISPQTNNFPQYVTNISPYNVQALAGPNSWTVTQPGGVNSNDGITQSAQTGFLTHFGPAGQDYQLFVESQNPVVTPEKNDALKLGADVRQLLMNDSDPRAYSYGPTDRVFIDDNTGIPYYFYKDIDQKRQIGYIQRNNTNLKFFESSTNDAKFFAEEQFIQDSNAQRLDLQNSLLRKRNSELWQRKVAPISSLGFPGKPL